MLLSIPASSDTENKHQSYFPKTIIVDTDNLRASLKDIARHTLYSFELPSNFQYRKKAEWLKKFGHNPKHLFVIVDIDDYVDVDTPIPELHKTAAVRKLKALNLSFHSYFGRSNGRIIDGKMKISVHAILFPNHNYTFTEYEDLNIFRALGNWFDSIGLQIDKAPLAKNSIVAGNSVANIGYCHQGDLLDIKSIVENYQKNKPILSTTTKSKFVPDDDMFFEFDQFYKKIGPQIIVKNLCRQLGHLQTVGVVCGRKQPDGTKPRSEVHKLTQGEWNKVCVMIKSVFGNSNEGRKLFWNVSEGWYKINKDGLKKIDTEEICNNYYDDADVKDGDLSRGISFCRKYFPYIVNSEIRQSINAIFTSEKIEIVSRIHKYISEQVTPNEYYCSSTKARKLYNFKSGEDLILKDVVKKIIDCMFDGLNVTIEDDKMSIGEYIISYKLVKQSLLKKHIFNHCISLSKIAKDCHAAIIEVLKNKKRVSSSLVQSTTKKLYSNIRFSKKLRLKDITDKIMSLGELDMYEKSNKKGNEKFFVLIDYKPTRGRPKMSAVEPHISQEAIEPTQPIPTLIKEPVEPPIPSYAPKNDIYMADEITGVVADEDGVIIVIDQEEIIVDYDREVIKRDMCGEEINRYTVPDRKMVGYQNVGHIFNRKFDDFDKMISYQAKLNAILELYGLDSNGRPIVDRNIKKSDEILHTADLETCWAVDEITNKRLMYA